MPKKRKKETIVGKHLVWLIGQRNGIWFADGRSNKMNVGRHSLGTRSRAEALQQLRRLDVAKAVEFGLADASELDAEANGVVELDQGVKLFLDHIRRPRIAGGANAKTVRRYAAVTNKAVKFFKDQGFGHWNQIRKRQLELYAGWLVENEYAYRTQFFELTVLKQLFNFLTDVHRAYLPRDCQIRMPLAKPSGSDAFCWRAIEVEAMIQHCRIAPELHWLGDIVVALATTGMRISELASLRWSDIDFVRNTIVLRDESRSKRASAGQVRTTKNRRTRAFPIHPKLCEVLKRRTEGHKNQAVFLGPLGGAIRPDAIRLALIKHVLIPLGDRFPSAKDELGFTSGRLHSFRHFFVSECANRGVPEQMVMQWLGHQSSIVTRLYYHLNDQESQRQMEKLESIGGPDAT